MRIILAGIIGRYPWGGVSWCSLMYLLGLRQAGHDVYYLEDTCECNFDPEINSPATDPRYALRYIDETLRPFDFGERWRYIDYRGKSYGMFDAAWTEVCAGAELLIVLSGGVWKWRAEYLQIPRRVFIDSDPGFTQLAMASADTAAREKHEPSWYVSFFGEYHHLFTFGQNIGKPGNPIPTCGQAWKPTTQPVCTGTWTPSSLPSRPVWTTIMTWQMESFADVGGNKDAEFSKIENLASRIAQNGGPALELAVNGPSGYLQSLGWRTTPAMAVSADIWRYHSYITSSRGEFSIAKHTYVATNSGWFSDRTACYLAAGKPAIVQETGQSQWLPTGHGLLTWKTEDEAFEHLQRVDKDYAHHSKAAREIALEHCSTIKIIPQLIDKAIQ